MTTLQPELPWVEKYRPNTIADCIIPQNLKQTFQEIVDKGFIPNMILTGKHGTGKTTVAQAICNQLGVEYLKVNASLYGNIDTLRNEVTQYASSRSFDGSRRCVIFDEADSSNPNSTQPALRAFIEEYAANCAFIFSCNHLNKIIPELHSRSSVIEFTIPKTEKESLMKQILKRLKFILDSENVQYDPKVLAQVVVKYWPDFRRTINELQRFYFETKGKITDSILSQIADAPMSALIKTLKEQDFTAMRKWVATNHDADPIKLMRKLYDSCYDLFVPDCIPGIVLLIGEYQYRSAFVADHEIHLAAFLTEVMQNAQFA